MAPKLSHLDSSMRRNTTNIKAHRTICATFKTIVILGTKIWTTFSGLATRTISRNCSCLLKDSSQQVRQMQIDLRPGTLTLNLKGVPGAVLKIRTAWLIHSQWRLCRPILEWCAVRRDQHPLMSVRDRRFDTRCQDSNKSERGPRQDKAVMTGALTWVDAPLRRVEVAELSDLETCLKGLVRSACPHQPFKSILNTGKSLMLRTTIMA